MSSEAAATRLGAVPRFSLRDDVGAAAARIRVNRLPVREDDDRPASTAMTAPIGRDEAEGRDAADQQHAQDLLGRVGHRRQRVGRQDGEPGDAREPFVMGEVRRNGRADEHALELGETTDRTRTPPTADGVS